MRHINASNAHLSQFPALKILARSPHPGPRSHHAAGRVFTVLGQIPRRRPGLAIQAPPVAGRPIALPARTMLQNLSQEIRECLRRAEECSGSTLRLSENPAEAAMARRGPGREERPLSRLTLT
jgi:hypothetical protein